MRDELLKARDGVLETLDIEFRLSKGPAAPAILGESPVWDEQEDCVWWVDIDGRQILRTNLGDGATRAWPTPEYPGFVVLTGSNQPAIGMQTGIFSFDPENHNFTRIVDFNQVGHRFNDAAVDADGQLWASTMSMEAHIGSGQIHKITSEMTLETIVENLTIPNGLAADANLGRLYYSDSHPDSQTIWFKKFEAIAAIADSGEVFATTKNLDGRPDGAAIDTLGRYWIAGVDGSELYVFSPLGKLISKVPTPFPCPTKPMFVGASKSQLVVTAKQAGTNGGRLAISSELVGHVEGHPHAHWRPGSA